MSVPEPIGVVGAGTMGLGIAQLAAQAGARTLLHDPVAEALGAARERIATGLERPVAKGRMTAAEAEAIVQRVETVDAAAELAPCAVVIEAAPERLDLKRELFAELAGAVAGDCVLATNTSSLSVTELAAGVAQPERVVGLHFFNPAPVMRLVEVVAGEASSEQALETAREVGRAMGKHVIDARDIAGFLVNRVNRPFSLESLRLLAEGVATVEQIDRIARLGGGFRMGPFELMDLVGIDTNHAVAEQFHRQTYGEPRYRPSPLAARMVAARTLGRKTGSGWYAYPEGRQHRPADPEPPAPGGGDGRVVTVRGEGVVAGALRSALERAGFAAAGEPWLAVDCDGGGPDAAEHRLVLVDRGSLHALDPGAAGFHLLPPLREGGLVELTATTATPGETVERARALVAALGQHEEQVGDAPGLVLGRVVGQLVNEAAFLIGEGNGTAADVDAGLELGVNHPRGPVAWSRQIGLDHVTAVLDALRRERGEAYRAAPLLAQRTALGAELA